MLRSSSILHLIGIIQLDNFSVYTPLKAKKINVFKNAKANDVS